MSFTVYGQTKEIPPDTKKLTIYNTVKILPRIPEGVEEIYCFDGKLNMIYSFPSTLKKIVFDKCKLVFALPPLPDSLISLSVSGSPLVKINDFLPPNLKDLFCNDCNLTGLPELPPTLERLGCNNNEIDFLPELPASLKRLDVSYNELASLPNLPANLSLLYCGNNQITSLPSLPDLEDLFCNDNKLSSLPNLPKSIRRLGCAHNPLSELPVLNDGLVEFDMGGTPLKAIPKLPNTLLTILIHDNKLEEPYLTAYNIYAGEGEHEDNRDKGNMEKLFLKVKRIKVQEAKAKIIINPWKGFTQSDMLKFDNIFDDAVAANHSLCPICLKYAIREDGCMYMTHDCSKLNSYYNKELYDIYKDDRGLITWCTICNRIAKSTPNGIYMAHEHYVLTPHTDTYLDTYPAGNPFEVDCSKTNGGGGPDEKILRFRRFREYAMELQREIGEISTEKAMSELCEEMWNAPLTRARGKLKNIKEGKKWNINSTLFPGNVVSDVEEELQELKPFTGELPTFLESGKNDLYLEDDIPVYQFHHKQEDGEQQNHAISLENLRSFIESANKNFGGENFGYCYMYPSCKSRIHPEEIRTILPELYEEYKNKFRRLKGGRILKGMRATMKHKQKHTKKQTKKQKQKQKGGGEDMLLEATNAMCVVPKKGGKTRRIKYKK
jgi:hypothetical protein